MADAPMPSMPGQYRRILADTGAAPIRAVLEAHGPFLALFSPSERNLIVRQALYIGCLFWRDHYFLFRFTNAGYAKAELGYHVTGAYESAKCRRYGNADPLTWSGNLRETAAAGVRIEARATSSNQSATIRIPAPADKRGFVYATAQPMVRQVLRSMPAKEVAAIAMHMDEAIASQLTHGTTVLADAGEFTARLNVGKVRRTGDLAFGRKLQRPAGTLGQLQRLRPAHVLAVRDG